MNFLNTKSKYVVGETLAEVIQKTQELQARGINAAIDHLGEAVTTVAQATKATNTYLDIIRHIKKHNLNAHIAIKLTQLGLAINTKTAAQNLKKIVNSARKNKVGVEIDIEDHRYTDGTLDLYIRSLKSYKFIATAIQAYLFRTQTDLQTLLKHKARIRLVKGTYNEPSTIAYHNKTQIRNQYIQFLHASLLNAPQTVIATHDKTIIKAAQHIITCHNIPQKRYEFEILYGYKPRIQKYLQKYNLPLRVYLPYGTHWHAYVKRRVKELRNVRN